MLNKEKFMMLADNRKAVEMIIHTMGESLLCPSNIGIEVKCEVDTALGKYNCIKCWREALKEE